MILVLNRKEKMKIKWIDLSSSRYAIAKLDSSQERLSFVDNIDGFFLFDWAVGDCHKISVEEAKKLDGHCITLCDAEEGKKLVDVTEAYFEFPDLEMPSFVQPIPTIEELVNLERKIQ